MTALQNKWDIVVFSYYMRLYIGAYSTLNQTISYTQLYMGVPLQAYHFIIVVILNLLASQYCRLD